MVTTKLFFAIINSNDLKVFWRIKAQYLDEKALKVYNFIREFISEYSKLPTIESLCIKFDLEFVEVKDDPEYLLSEVIAIYRKLVIEEAAKNAIRGRSIEPFKEAIEKYYINENNSSSLSYAQSAKDRIDRYEEIKGTGGIRYLSTGNQVLDEIFLGYNRTDYVLIGGEEGLGKTWYLIRRALAVTKEIKQPVLVISGEMGTDEFEERADCISAGISYRHYNRGTLSDEAVEKREKTLKVLSKSTVFGKNNMIIKDDCFTLTDVENQINILNPAIIFIDGLHLFSKSIDWKDMLYTSMQIKKFTRKYRVPIIAMMHLRESIKDPDKAGTGSFAYFKGARDPDIAMVMFQDDLMKVNQEIGLKIVKGRKEGSGNIIMTRVNYFTQQEDIWYEGTLE